METDSRGTGWVDISVPLREGMVVWPGDPPFAIERLSDVARGEQPTVSRVTMSTHTGTHVDAPLHCFPTAAGIDRMPLDVSVGRARVIEVHDPVAIRAEELSAHRIQAGERVLLKTVNSERRKGASRFVEDFVHLELDAARLLASQRVRLVGVDCLSVGGMGEGGLEVHRALLESGVWIVEGLDLSAVGVGDYDLVCLPLRIEDGDGAPARVIVRPLRAVQPGIR